jgi:hypothetical protein
MKEQAFPSTVIGTGLTRQPFCRIKRPLILNSQGPQAPISPKPTESTPRKQIFIEETRGGGLTQAQVLVDIRNSIPKLTDLKGWGNFTADSDLFTHTLEGITDLSLDVFLPTSITSYTGESIMSIGILLCAKGLQGKLDAAPPKF